MSVVWREDPENFCPAAHLPKGTERFKVGAYWVDWNEKGTPTVEKIEAVLAAAAERKPK